MRKYKHRQVPAARIDYDFSGCAYSSGINQLCGSRLIETARAVVRAYNKQRKLRVGRVFSLEFFEVYILNR
jgi:hypothetical protein